MIRISIDDSLAEETRWERAECVEDVVNAVASNLPPNRIVTSIFVDGQQVPRQQASQALKGRLEAIRELQIRTADAHTWASHGLDRAVSDIDRLQKSLQAAAELYWEGKVVEGSRIFVRCVEGLERFLETIVLTRLAMNLDFQRLTVDGISLARLESDFALTLRRIVDCQERQDYEGLADKVEFSLLPCFSSWTRALIQIQRSLAEA